VNLRGRKELDVTFLRLVRFKLLRDRGAQATVMAYDLIPAIKQQPGCVSAMFFDDGPDGDSGLCVVWDSLEHAEAATQIIGPRLLKYLEGATAGAPEIQLLPVLAS
jgi:hypothetical protein